MSYLHKTIILVVILATTLFFTNFSASPARRVEWLTPTSHDFETIKEGKPVRCKFKFKNISDAPLTIDNVRAPCSCTVPDWDEEVIPPNGTSVIDITFDAEKTGYFKKKITVWFHDQKSSEKLYIEGTVE